MRDNLEMYLCPALGICTMDDLEMPWTSFRDAESFAPTVLGAANIITARASLKNQ